MPPFVQVLGCILTVREAVDDELDSETAAAMLYPHQALIVYDPNLDEEEMRDAILHEIIHYIDFKITGRYELNERQVCRLAACLTATLRTNQELTAWLGELE